MHVAGMGQARGRRRRSRSGSGARCGAAAPDGSVVVGSAEAARAAAVAMRQESAARPRRPGWQPSRSPAEPQRRDLSQWKARGSSRPLALSSSWSNSWRMMRKPDGSPRAVARMDARSIPRPATRHDAAQAGGEPELVIVAGAAVEADHQADLAQPVFECIDIGQQVVRAASSQVSIRPTMRGCAAPWP